MNSQQTPYRASAKVLLAGGYGVLQPGNCGLPLALRTHFYTLTAAQRTPSSEPVRV
jgi:hypothetical protein